MDYNQIRTVLELLYFLSGIILAIVGTIALVQIFLAKRTLSTAQKNLQLAVEAIEIAKTDIQVRSEREAVVLAAERCDIYANEILPFIGDLLVEMYSKGISVEEWKLVNTSLDDSSLSNWDKANAWLDKIDLTISNQIITFFNKLESLSVYFVKGAADEQVAFPSIAITFCSDIEKLAPFLIKLRQQRTTKHTKNYIEHPSGPFQNTIQLYAIWADRIKKQDLELSASRITQELSGITTEPVLPIGKSFPNTDASKK